MRPGLIRSRDRTNIHTLAAQNDFQTTALTVWRDIFRLPVTAIVAQDVPEPRADELVLEGRKPFPNPVRCQIHQLDHVGRGVFRILSVGQGRLSGFMRYATRNGHLVVKSSLMGVDSPFNTSPHSFWHFLAVNMVLHVTRFVLSWLDERRLLPNVRRR